MIAEAILVAMTSQESFNHLAIHLVTIITCFAHGELLSKKDRDSRTGQQTVRIYTGYEIGPWIPNKGENIKLEFDEIAIEDTSL